MLIDFRCRRCRTPLSIESDQKGNTIRCPTCDCEMVVPVASEPGTPRGGQMVQGVYALLGEVEDHQESMPASGPLTPAEGPGYGLQADPLFQEIPKETTQELLPGSLGSAAKTKKKRRRRHAADSPPRPARRWSPRAMVLAGGLVLVIAVIGSARHVRHGEDGDATIAADVPAQIAESSGPTLVASLRATLPDPPPPAGRGQVGGTVVQKDQREENKGPQKRSGAREAASETLGRAARNVANERMVSPLPAADFPPARSGSTPPYISSSQMAIPVVKRRRNLSEEDLRKELRLMPEIPNLNLSAMNRLVSAQKVEVEYHQYIDHEPNFLLKIRPDLKALPVRKGRSCQVDKRSAINLGVFSQKLHALVDHPIPEESNGQHTMPALLQKFLQMELRGNRPEWLRAEAIPALQQILMQESQPLRWLLVEILAKIPGPEASVALAQRALYDLSPEVRALAINALHHRSRPEYRQVLLNGLRYPWAPVADHAAEALAALKSRGVVPILVAYLKDADQEDAMSSFKSQTLRREMVRINHSANCLMCHPPAARLSDPVIAPVPGLFLVGSVPRSTGHYGSIQTSVPTRSGFFVRVDITYLRQDFSIREPSKALGTDVNLRFDFLVRTRKAPKAKAAKPQQREAVLFALRELTGMDAGSESNAWVKLIPPAILEDEAGRSKSSW